VLNDHHRDLHFRDCAALRKWMAMLPIRRGPLRSLSSRKTLFNAYRFRHVVDRSVMIVRPVSGQFLCSAVLTSAYAVQLFSDLRAQRVMARHAVPVRVPSAPPNHHAVCSLVHPSAHPLLRPLGSLNASSRSRRRSWLSSVQGRETGSHRLDGASTLRGRIARANSLSGRPCSLARCGSACPRRRTRAPRAR
jgi:hypothetical protein